MSYFDTSIGSIDLFPKNKINLEMLLSSSNYLSYDFTKNNSENLFNDTKSIRNQNLKLLRFPASKECEVIVIDKNDEKVSNNTKSASNPKSF